jgi:hypothetical protein
MLNDDELAAFQALLLDRLERGVPPDQLKAELLAHPAAAPFRDYVESFEPRCLEVASHIVKKWAVRTS